MISAINHKYSSQKTFVVNIPRARYKEPIGVAAKKKELQNFDDFEVYTSIDKPKDQNLISTDWVIVEKHNSKTGNSSGK